MASAREVAMLTLAACQRQGAWSDNYLKRALRQAGLERRDAALATRLCFGVLQNQILLDWHLQHYCTAKLEKLELNVLCNLRVAAYQLLFLDKIPPSAAVNEAVNLTRKFCRNPKAAGMVNGVLRSMLRAEAPVELPEKPEATRLSIQYSHPEWLVERFLERLGREQTERLLDANNCQPPISAQVNTCKAAAGDVAASVAQQGASSQMHPWMADCLQLAQSGNLEQLQAYQDGQFYVQDCAARCAVIAAGLTPGQNVLDCCAAPGGKSFAAAIAMQGKGSITSCDIHPHKIKLIEAGRDRLGLDIISPMLQSALELREEWVDRFDTVLCDVPCSGLGIIRKKPDIRYKDPKPLANLPAIQRKILENTCAYVRPGGVMLYATCTLLSCENEGVVTSFLAQHPEFSCEGFELPFVSVPEGMFTFWPHLHDTDGFFVAKLRKKE